MSGQRRFQGNFASPNYGFPDRSDECQYNSRNENYNYGPYNNDFAQPNDYQQSDYNYGQYNQGPGGHTPRYSGSNSIVGGDRINYDANFDCNYTNSNNRSGNFQGAPFQPVAFGGPSDSPPDYQAIIRSSGLDCSKPPNRPSWGSVGAALLESPDETRKRCYPGQDSRWGRDVTKQKRTDLDSVPLDLTQHARHDETIKKMLSCAVCNMTFSDIKEFQVHANTMVHIQNAALAVEKTLVTNLPAGLASNLMPNQKSLLGPVPNAPPVERNSFGNVATNQRNILNQFAKRNPQRQVRNDSANYDNQTGFHKSFKEPPRNFPGNNWQRNNKQTTGPNPNSRFKPEQSFQPDRMKFKPRNGPGIDNAFRQQFFPQKNVQREQPVQSKWKKFPQNTPKFAKGKKLLKQGNLKKESQDPPKSFEKSSLQHAEGPKVDSEEHGSKPDSSSLLFSMEEPKMEPENTESPAFEYEDNMDIELSFRPSLPPSKVHDGSPSDNLEAAETAKESEVISRALADPGGDDVRTGEDPGKDAPLGQEYVVSVTGFFCKLCSKFYNKESMAKIDHCRSDQHINNYRKVHEPKEGAVQ